MATTITLTGDWMVSLGNRRQTSGTGNVGTYATGGIAVTPGQVGLGRIDSLVIDPAGGYIFEYVASTGKIKAYVHGGFAAHSHNLVFKNAAVADGATTRINAGTNLLGANTGSDITVAGGGANGGVQNLASDGGGSPGAEVTASTNLSGVTFNFRAVGI